MMFSKDLFSSRLKEVRKGFTQAQAAQKVGLSQQGWARYESGKVLPGAEAIHQICSSYNVSSDWLLGLDTSKVGPECASTPQPPPVSPSGDCANCKYKRLAEVIKATL